MVTFMSPAGKIDGCRDSLPPGCLCVHLSLTARRLLAFKTLRCDLWCYLFWGGGNCTTQPPPRETETFCLIYQTKLQQIATFIHQTVQQKCSQHAGGALSRKLLLENGVRELESNSLSSALSFSCFIKSTSILATAFRRLLLRLQLISPVVFWGVWPSSATIQF